MGTGQKTNQNSFKMNKLIKNCMVGFFAQRFMEEFLSNLATMDFQEGRLLGLWLGLWLGLQFW